MLHALYIARSFIRSSSRVLRHSTRSKACRIRGKKGAKSNICLPAFVSPRENRRPKEAKTKIYFTFGAFVAFVVALHLGRWSCPLGAGGAGFQGLSSLSWRVPSLSPCLLSLYCFCFPAMPAKHGFISRFKGVFSVVCGFGVGLLGLGALRGLWGFCTRE